MRSIEEIPRVPLIQEPTPLHPLRRLTGSLGGPQIWCKRDDLTRLALGGNKLRKLEFLLKDALDQGADTIITTGAAQSNHARLTAAAAASLGLRTVLILDHPKIGNGQGNLLLDDLVGAEIRFGSWESWEAGAVLLEKVAEEVRAEGHRPYIIPMGGTNALGVLGYAVAALEIARQAAAGNVPVRAVICATSSCGTQAGLVLGKVLYNLPFDVIGISVSEPAAKQVPTVARFASAGASLLGAGPVSAAAVTVLDGYVGPGYGKVNAATVEAIRTMASLEGVLLDPVYTGKAMAALLDLVKKGTWKPYEAIVFLHTGGIPALFAYREALGVRAGTEE